MIIPVTPNINIANIGIQSELNPLTLSTPINLPILFIILLVKSTTNSAICFNHDIEDNVSLHNIPKEDNIILNINLIKDKDNILNELNMTNTKYKLYNLAKVLGCLIQNLRKGSMTSNTFCITKPLSLGNLFIIILKFEKFKVLIFLKIYLLNTNKTLIVGKTPTVKTNDDVVENNRENMVANVFSNLKTEIILLITKLAITNVGLNLISILF
jgi:hypothetical protein